MSLYKGFLAYLVYLYLESPEVVRGDQVCLYFVEKGNLKFSDPNMHGGRIRKILTFVKLKIASKIFGKIIRRPL